MSPKSLPIVQISLPTPWRQVDPVYAYLIKSDPITLVDTGLGDQPSREALQEGLRRAGVSVKDIRRVLLTHAHWDHFGQAAWIQDQSGAEVYLHPDEKGKADAPPWWVEAQTRSLEDAGVPRETRETTRQAWRHGRRLQLPLSGWLPLADGQRLAFEDGELEAVHLPGHALGHTGFWDAAGGALIGGDHLLQGISPNPMLEPLPDGHPAAAPHAPYRALALGQFLQAQRRVMDMPVRKVLPGHGPVIHLHTEVAQTYIAKHERRMQSLWRRIRTGTTAFAVSGEIYPWVRGFDIFLALSEVLAHLDLLVVRGKAVVEPGVRGSIYQAVESPV